MEKKKTNRKPAKKKLEEDKIVENNNEKTEFSLIEVIIIMIICIVFGLLIGGYIVSQKKYNSNDEHKIDFNEINGLYEDIKNNYYGEYAETSFRDNTVNGMLSSLKDPFARLITNEEAEKYQEDLESEFIGIGVTITTNSDGLPVVMEVFKASPAEKSGMKENDIFIKVDDKDLNGMPLEETISLIKKGNRGDKVKITVRREDKDIDITISKDIITTPTVSYSIANKDEKKIAKIVISNFSKNTFVEFKDIYNEIKKEKVDGIILDLRGNGGGYLSSASLVASMFLDKDKVIYIEKIKDKEEKIFSKDERIIKENTVILIDGGTASASEILASALKINNGVQLVGNTTYGKNTIQKIHKLKDGALVKFTIGEWFNANEKSVLEEPIHPDKPVNYVEGTDAVLNEAIKLF